MTGRTPRWNSKILPSAVVATAATSLYCDGAGVPAAVVAGSGHSTSLRPCWKLAEQAAATATRHEQTERIVSPVRPSSTA